jgi:hypothetical protein
VQRWLTVVLLVMLVLAGAMGVRNLVTAQAGPVTVASGSAPVPPTPWMSGSAPVPPTPWMSGSAPVPPTPWAK